MRRLMFAALVLAIVAAPVQAATHLTQAEARATLRVNFDMLAMSMDGVVRVDKCIRRTPMKLRCYVRVVGARQTLRIRALVWESRDGYYVRTEHLEE